MRKRLLSSFVALLGVVAVVYTVVTQPGRAQIPSARMPCSATFIRRYYDASGTLRRTSTYLVATRADGSSMVMHLTRDDRPDRWSTVTNLADGTQVTVEPVGQSTTTNGLSDAERRMMSLPPTCPAPSGGAKTTLLGCPVVLDREQHVFGAKKIEEPRWLAPSLGCLCLERSYQTLVGGTLGGKTTETAISVTLGTPDPSLFKIPAGYTERSPSEAMAERAQVLGQSCPSCDGAREVIDKVCDSRHNF